MAKALATLIMHVHTVGHRATASRSVCSVEHVADALLRSRSRSAASCIPWTSTCAIHKDVVRGRFEVECGVLAAEHHGVHADDACATCV